jgi:hypothetical protein
MGFGGPVWHASASHPKRAFRRKAALRALEGVGLAALGEWHEDRERAYHVRRRLAPAEALRVGEVLDLRGTHEAEARAEVFVHSIRTERFFIAARMAMIEELNQ